MAAVKTLHYKRFVVLETVAVRAVHMATARSRNPMRVVLAAVARFAAKPAIAVAIEGQARFDVERFVRKLHHLHLIADRMRRFGFRNPERIAER